MPYTPWSVVAFEQPTAAKWNQLGENDAYLKALALPLENGRWELCSETWTRTGNHTFTVSGDQTAKYRKGAKLRYKDGSTYEYGTVFSSAYSAPNTTVTLFTNTDYLMAATTITDRYISFDENPEGFPVAFNYALTLTAPGGTVPTFSTVLAKFSVLNGVIKAWGNLQNTTGGTAGAGAVILNISLPAAEPYGISLVGNGVCYSAGVTFLGVLCRASGASFYMHDNGMANVNAASFSNAARQIHFEINYLF